MFTAAMPFFSDLRAVITTNSTDMVNRPVRVFVQVIHLRTPTAPRLPRPRSNWRIKAVIPEDCSCCSRVGVRRCSSLRLTAYRSRRKVATATRLMHAGAAIHELNWCGSICRGSREASLRPRPDGRSRWRSRIVQAPIADDPSVIGSGPTVADDTTFADALEIVGRYGITLPDAVRAHLDRGGIGQADETIKSGTCGSAPPPTLWSATV